MERTADTVRDIMAGRSGGLRGYPAFGGPGVIASIADMDSGNCAINIKAGFAQR